MKSILLFLLCFISVSSSFGDTLAQFITKDSAFIPFSLEQANQAPAVDKLTVGNLKAGTLFGTNFMMAEDVQDKYLAGNLSQKPVLISFARSQSIEPADYPNFSICSFSMTAGSGSMINVQSFSFVYSQLSRANVSLRSGMPAVARPCAPIEFTLMARIDGGKYITLQTLFVEGGSQEAPEVLGEKLKFDLSSQDIQSKIGSATSIEFNLVGKFGELNGETEIVNLAFDNIKVDGSIVPSSPSVPEPSSALLCMVGLLPLLRRKRNS